MNSKKLALVGAHPDDCDILGSGLTMRYRELGWDVMFVSMANGNCGHQEMTRADLAARRANESAAVAKLLGIEYVVMDTPDCEVEPTLEQRWALLRLLRSFAPDLVVTHHAMDYHPDHRYTCQLVGDVSYLLKVPNCCPDTPALRKDTVHAFFHAVRAAERADAFAVAVPVDDLWRHKLEVMACHESQMFEWLPWVSNEDMTAIPPAEDHEARLAFIDERRRRIFSLAAGLYRDRLVELLGPAKGQAVELAEVYYSAPFPTPLSAENYRDLFPFMQ